MSEYRVERDTPGEVKVPRRAYWGVPGAAAEEGVLDEAKLEKLPDVRGTAVPPRTGRKKNAD